MQGVQTFASQFGYTAQSYPYGDSNAATAEDALRQAAESGAALVVCRGEEMARALFNIQANYPNVSYLLFDDEPHNDDYTAYTTEPAVHCVLFREEEIGYLAGYAAVAAGYTGLGFVGARNCRAPCGTARASCRARRIRGGGKARRFRCASGSPATSGTWGL